MLFFYSKASKPKCFNSYYQLLLKPMRLINSYPGYHPWPWNFCIIDTIRMLPLVEYYFAVNALSLGVLIRFFGVFFAEARCGSHRISSGSFMVIKSPFKGQGYPNKYSCRWSFTVSFFWVFIWVFFELFEFF